MNMNIMNINLNNKMSLINYKNFFNFGGYIIDYKMILKQNSSK